LKVGECLKEIGDRLRETRLEMGVSIEEASEDLKLRPSQIKAIEEGNMKVFKDIFALKYFIRDYAKYLGLDCEDMVDDFNEYLFDYTSKISLEDIKKAKTEVDENEEEKICSPYTFEHKKKSKWPKIIAICTVVIVAFGIFGFYNQKQAETVAETAVVMRTL
jgi:cytoskeletal protein RodZ